jgi:penicillin amidase
MAYDFHSAAPADVNVTRRPRRVLRRLALAFALLIGLLVLAAGAGWIWLRARVEASLPQLDGSKTLVGLSDAVDIERDELGVPTIRAGSRVDAARALGFLHAQDRFFQMDLLRRQGAAELAEIFGPAAAQLDRQRRVHRFRDVARRAASNESAENRALLAAYAEGVNAGLSALGDKPFEYVVLRTDPVPWRPEDSMLVFYAMFFELHDARAAANRAWDFCTTRCPLRCSSSSLRPALNGTRR